MRFFLCCLCVLLPFCVHPQLSLDTTYANEGINNTGLQSYNTYTGGGLGISNSPFFMADNSILVPYTLNPYYSTQSVNLAPTIGIRKYLENGTLDSTFGTDGTALIQSNFYRDRFEVYGVNTDANGRIILVGRKYTIGVFSRDYEVFVCRLNANGTKDNTFANNGFFISNLYYENSADTNDERLFDVIIDSQNRVIAVGYIYWDIGVNLYDGAATAIRFLENGTLDTTFANNGIFQLSVTGVDLFSSVYQSTNNSLLLFGSTSPSNSQLLVTKIDSNGVLDTSFGTNGSATVDFGGNTSAMKIFFESDNSMMLTGQRLSSGVAFAKLTENGILDTTFSTDGKNISVITVPNHESVGAASYPGIGAKHIDKLPDGKYIILATVRTGNLYNYSIVRLNADATRDNTFMTNGVYLNDIVAFDWARALHVQNDGKLSVLVGSTLFKYINFSVLTVDDFEEKTITVYPNPTKEFLNLGFVATKTTILNIQGKAIATHANVEKINFSNYPNGVYIVKILKEDGSNVFKKVIKE
ncbi:T9SS type A sorting domain-containing protein [Flavobacterium dankookense]|uniref:Putative delta-60 repeat protein/predicted secreted protein (Por secretion system target) n=1 Tax=Flavobacterium dankookense TaxID=706186 RepID=A0A4R6QA46_9FLAO|nr:T9SS type A sorting domain-containing protein [Flavobacterium dankookense]TDP58603.1 putative delta-60 repeat protein/predicted secreted protein (Por secretion system target) [Flavobacterium dankookense]